MKPILTTSVAAAAACFLVTLSARATTLGLSNDPAQSGWDRGDANTGFAVWDSFPSFSYSGDAPDAGAGITTPTLAQSGALADTSGGGGLYNVFLGTPTPAGQSGDVLFGGGNSISFLAGGTVAFTIRGVVLQVKRPRNQGTLGDVLAPRLVINGGAEIAPDTSSLNFGAGDTSSDSPGNYGVTSWYWNDSLASLPTAGTETFSISFGNASLQRGVDGVAVDVGNVKAVPEPGIAALLLFAGPTLCWRRRRSAGH